MIELIMKYRNKDNYDYSCSETILRAADEYYNLNLSDNEFKMVAPFSGGMFEGDLCGIVSAAVCVLGILFTDGVAHTSPVLIEAVKKYKGLFYTNFDSITCNELVQEYRDELNGCTDLIVKGAVLLDEVVKDIRKQYHYE